MEIVTVHGKLYGEKITVRSISSGRARFQEDRFTFNIEQEKTSTFPAYIVDNIIHCLS
jgi:hypothetical protein